MKERRGTRGVALEAFEVRKLEAFIDGVDKRFLCERLEVSPRVLARAVAGQRVRPRTAEMLRHAMLSSSEIEGSS